MLTMPDAIALSVAILGLLGMSYKYASKAPVAKEEKAYCPAHMDMADRVTRHEEKIKALDSWMKDLDDKYERIMETLTEIKIQLAKQKGTQ